MFARDPDAILDLVEVFPTDLEEGETVADRLHDTTGNASAWRLTNGGLREFPSFEPRHILFKHPRHYTDLDGITADWVPQSAQQMIANKKRAGKESGKAREEKSELARMEAEIILSQHFISEGIGRNGMQLNRAAEIAGVTTRTLKKYLQSSEMFEVETISRNQTLIVPKQPPPLELDASR